MSQRLAIRCIILAATVSVFSLAEGVRSNPYVQLRVETNSWKVLIFVIGIYEELPGLHPVISVFTDSIVQASFYPAASEAGPIRSFRASIQQQAKQELSQTPYQTVPFFPFCTHSIVTLQTINKFPKESLLSHIVLFCRPYVAT